MIITISGLPGSGKTTVARMAAKRMGFSHYSAGDMRGRMAMERGLTIDQLNEIGKKEEWTDKDVDKVIEDLGKKKDNIVVDGWVAFRFIPRSVKIFLYVDLKVGAKRIFMNQRKDEERKGSVREIYEMIRKRVKESNERYKKHYGIDFLDGKNYDHIIDTTHLHIEQVVEKVIEFCRGKD
jgi:cytidylate kinase